VTGHIPTQYHSKELTQDVFDPIKALTLNRENIEGDSEASKRVVELIWPKLEKQDNRGIERQGLMAGGSNA
jgi:hypothetical protein